MKWLIPLLLISLPTMAQNHLMPLWPQGIPNHIPNNLQETHENDEILWITLVDTPSIEVYLPARRRATQQAVVICPGGGYMGLAYDWEGSDVAKWLNAQGIAGIVLKYRLPSTHSNQEPHKAPLQDAQQALKLTREYANAWNIDPNKVGVMGFSAGGHLASTLGTHFNDNLTRPDFMVLIYPVISMEAEVTHGGSRQALLGDQPSEELIVQYSNEKQVTEQTPPTFLVHSADDEAVPITNSLLFQEALLEQGVANELHAYPYGGHGYSLAIGQGRLGQWPRLLLSWLLELH